VHRKRRTLANVLDRQRNAQAGAADAVYLKIASYGQLFEYSGSLFRNQDFSANAICVNGGIRGNAAVVQSPQQQRRANDAQDKLYTTEHDGIFSRFRHAPLFAQVGLLVVLGFAAFQLCPVGFDGILPVANRVGRRLWSAILLLAFGLLSLFALLGIILLGCPHRRLQDANSCG
jgi:hypothetical protein